MKNVQISFDENLLDAVDRIAASNKLTRSAIVREVLKKWVREKEINRFENKWIKKLKEHPDNAKDVEDWEKIEQWSD